MTLASRARGTGVVMCTRYNMRLIYIANANGTRQHRQCATARNESDRVRSLRGSACRASALGHVKGEVPALKAWAFFLWQRARQVRAWWVCEDSGRAEALDGPEGEEGREREREKGCRVGGSAKSSDTSRMDVSQRGTQRSSIKSGLGQPPAKRRPDSQTARQDQTRPDSTRQHQRVSRPGQVYVEFGSSGWSGSPRPSVPGHGGRAWSREEDQGGIPVGANSPAGRGVDSGSRGFDSMGFKVLRRRRPLPLPASGVLACF